MNSERFERVVAYFDGIDRATNYVYWGNIPTAGGSSMPTDIRKFGRCLEDLFDKRITRPSRVFHDAGYGDSRVVDTADAYGFAATGSEIDALWAACGKRHTKNLHDAGAVNEVRLAHGNFIDDRTYHEGLGLDFSDVNVFFNFQNNPEMLAGKIAKQSPSGTVLLLACHLRQHPGFAGLESIATLPLDPNSKWAQFLHVYRKWR